MARAPNIFKIIKSNSEKKYDKWKVKVDTTQINFKELYFR